MPTETILPIGPKTSGPHETPFTLPGKPGEFPNLETQKDAGQKAFELNLDRSIYGTLAEIGAGQEVARWFFRVGGAAGTIAKTMSAYDMQISDTIYGPAKRYVSRERLTKMLEKEFDLLRQRLGKNRGSASRFFAFANTVATRSFRGKSDGRGWLGIRFQHETGEAPSDVIIHARLTDEEVLQQQDALGLLGVNLIFGATKLFADPEHLILSLMDNLGTARVEVDMIETSGPAFAEVDNRVLALKLVEHGLTKAAMLTPEGKVVQPSEVLYGKPVLLERGLFHPPSQVHVDMLESAQKHLWQDPQAGDQEPVVLLEMNLKHQPENKTLSPEDFLTRADHLASLGHPVMVSNYYRHFRVADYLFRATNERVAMVMGISGVAQLFEEKYYTDLNGGILESFGRMFKNDLVLYAYPTKNTITGELETAESLRVAPHLRHLYSHLLQNGKIVSLHDHELSHTPRHTEAISETNEAFCQGLDQISIADLMPSTEEVPGEDASALIHRSSN